MIIEEFISKSRIGSGNPITHLKTYNKQNMQVRDRGTVQRYKTARNLLKGKYEADRDKGSIHNLVKIQFEVFLWNS